MEGELDIKLYFVAVWHITCSIGNSILRLDGLDRFERGQLDISNWAFPQTEHVEMNLEIAWCRIVSGEVLMAQGHSCPH